ARSTVSLPAVSRARHRGRSIDKSKAAIRDLRLCASARKLRLRVSSVLRASKYSGFSVDEIDSRSFEAPVGSFCCPIYRDHSGLSLDPRWRVFRTRAYSRFEN